MLIIHRDTTSNIAISIHQDYGNSPINLGPQFWTDRYGANDDGRQVVDLGDEFRENVSGNPLRFTVDGKHGAFYCRFSHLYWTSI